MINSRLIDLENYEKICNCININIKYSKEIYISDKYISEKCKLIMLNYCYFIKELCHIKNIIIDVTNINYPRIFINAIPYFKECFYKSYDPLELKTEFNHKIFSNVSFGLSSEFINSKCNNIIRRGFHIYENKWFFSSNKKINELSWFNIDVNKLNKKYIYTFNCLNNENQLICVHVHSGIYTRKLPLYFFKSKNSLNINSPEELIENIKKFDYIIYFNPKIKCYIKLINNFYNFISEELNYLLKRPLNRELTQLEKKIEKDILWLSDYILNCYHRKTLNKNLTFNIEEFYIIKKIYNQENLLEKINEELSKSTPKQLDNLIKNMYKYYDSCIN